MVIIALKQDDRLKTAKTAKRNKRTYKTDYFVFKVTYGDQPYHDVQCTIMNQVRYILWVYYVSIQLTQFIAVVN